MYNFASALTSKHLKDVFFSGRRKKVPNGCGFKV